MNRRSFVMRLMLGVAGAACLPEPCAAYAKKRLSKIGVQLYTVRRELEADFEGTLAKVASFGFREVEFAGYYGRTPRPSTASGRASTTLSGWSSERHEK